MKPLAAFSFFDPAVAESPFEFYAALRREAPVHLVPGLGFYLVSRHALVCEALRDPARFSSRFAAAMQARVGGMRPELAAIWAEGWPPADTLLTNDPPSHGRFRALVTKAFSARRVRSMEHAIRALAGELVDGLLRDGTVELVERFAVPLPLTVIADQLGVPRADLPRFKKWSDDSVAPLGQMISPEREIECARSVVEFQHYFAAIAAARRAEPRDDLISDLVHAKVEGERPLDTGELLSVLQQLLVAGNETTTNLIAAAVQLLVEHPESMQMLRERPERIPNAVEEVLRLESPVQGMWRVASEATSLGGVEIPKGAFVMLRYAAANRDEDVFPDPDRFDVLRANAREHLAFGMGIHFCVGAALARAEASAALATLLARTRAIRFAPGRNAFRHHPSILLRGLAELWVELEAA